MRLAQDGDQAAYRSLLTNITPYLRTLCARQHRDARDVEDSVQDILLTLHTIRHTYDPARPFKPWLVAIGRRRIIDRLRTNRRSRLRETELLAEHETFSIDESNIHEAQSESRVLRDAVESLPKGQRDAVTLLKIEEKSLAEAAAQSGMTVAALKVSTHRAVKALRKILEGKRQSP
ncbi:MAG TPA: sigma-70 family RNA polymerase sigma factor [Micropepsaceae bacterium]|nr:sigma-70 family RNA polymerase sigma factor [Micropepsaceae bacterium]